MKRNRWFIALAAVGLHISIGSVYAWSVLARPVMEEMGVTLSEATWAFSIAILFLGLSAGFLGHFVERMGPRRSGLLSAGFFCAGLLGTAWAVETKSLGLLYLSYGFIGGIGLGTGYITPVATLVKWFPRNRGFATGLAIMGFGFAAFLAGPVMQALTAAYGLFWNFVIMAAAYALVMSLSALYLAPPRPGDLGEDLAGVLKEELAAGAPLPERKQYTRREALRTPEFYGLWLIFFINITCGIGLLAVASPMAQEVIGMTAGGAASLVGIIGIVNGAGRILWSSMSDWLGRGTVYLLFFTMEVFAFWQLAGTTDASAFAAWVLLIISCYGGGFSRPLRRAPPLLHPRRHPHRLGHGGHRGSAPPLPYERRDRRLRRDPPAFRGAHRPRMAPRGVALHPPEEMRRPPRGRRSVKINKKERKRRAVRRFLYFFFLGEDRASFRMVY